MRLRIANATCMLLSVTLSCAAGAQSGQGSLAAIRAACADDARKLCAGVQQGGGRIAACLKEHKDELSDQCKQAAGVAASGSSTPGTAGSAGAVSSPRASATGSGTATSAADLDPNATPAPAHKPGSASAASSGPGAGASTAAGEKFAERVIRDTEHEAMRVATIHLPEKWTYDSKVEWHYNWVENPLAVSLHAENPENAEGYFLYPLLRLDSMTVSPQYAKFNRGNQTKPGERMSLGAIAMGAPLPPVQALALFIQKTRPDVTNLKWLGQQDLPGLAKALNVDPGWPNQHGVAVKVGYDLNGQPVEEAFFGVYYISKGGNDAMTVGQMSMAAGAIQQTNWGFTGLQSFRAPAGTLDKRMPMFCVIAKSVYVNPVWAKLSGAINKKMQAEFQQKLKQGYDQLRAAEAIRQQTMKDQATFQANFDKQEIAFRNSGGVNDDFLRSDGSRNPDAGARSATDHWSDLMRNVDTVNDSSTGGTKEVSNLGGYNHFTDGLGNYRTYDSPNDTPENQGENGSWTRMPEAP